jgi:hypothetical protein
MVFTAPSSARLEITISASAAAARQTHARRRAQSPLDPLIIYWGGGSRRFIYAPSKLDPNVASWMANKFQLAMPGALLGTDHIVAAHQRRLEDRSSRCMRLGAPFQLPLTFFH